MSYVKNKEKLELIGKALKASEAMMSDNIYYVNMHPYKKGPSSGPKYSTSFYDD